MITFLVTCWQWSEQYETRCKTTAILCTMTKITMTIFLSQCSMIVTRRALASHTMLSRFSFRRKVRFAPAPPLLRVEVEILCGKTLTGSSMMWRGECSTSSSFISQPDECARRPSREVDLIWKFESYRQIINKYQKRMPRPRNRPWLLFIFGEQCKIDNAAAIQEW